MFNYLFGMFSTMFLRKMAKIRSKKFLFRCVVHPLGIYIDVVVRKTEEQLCTLTSADTLFYGLVRMTLTLDFSPRQYRAHGSIEQRTNIVSP